MSNLTSNRNWIQWYSCRMATFRKTKQNKKREEGKRKY